MLIYDKIFKPLIVVILIINLSDICIMAKRAMNINIFGSSNRKLDQAMDIYSKNKNLTDATKSNLFLQLDTPSEFTIKGKDLLCLTNNNHEYWTEPVTLKIQKNSGKIILLNVELISCDTHTEENCFSPMYGEFGAFENGNNSFTTTIDEYKSEFYMKLFEPEPYLKVAACYDIYICLNNLEMEDIVVKLFIGKSSSPTIAIIFKIMLVCAILIFATSSIIALFYCVISREILPPSSNFMLAPPPPPTSQISWKDIDESLPNQQYSKIPTRNSLKSCCSICLEEFEDTSICKELACSHIFHKDCLKYWLLKQKRCPNCKFDLESISSTFVSKKKELVGHNKFDKGAGYDNNIIEIEMEALNQSNKQG